MSDVKAGDILATRLVTGEEIIFTVTEEYNISRVRLVVPRMNPQTGSIEIMFAPFMASNIDGVFELADNSVLCAPVSVAADMERAYLQQVSGIQMATANDFNLAAQ